MRSKSFKYKLLRVGISAATLSVSLLMLVNFLVVRSFSSNKSAAPEFSKAIAAQRLGLPVRLEGIEGQMDLSVRYLVRGPGSTFYFKPEEGAMVLRNREEGEWSIPSVLKLKFIEASPHSMTKGIDGARRKERLFIGTDSNQKLTSISNYGKMAYQGWHADLEVNAFFYSHLDEWGCSVSPGKHLRLPHLHLEGAEELLVDSNGNLRIRMEDSQELCMQKPFVYQLVKGEKVRIEAQFTLLAKNEIGFEIGYYDESQVLVIDPVLVYPV